MRPDRQIYCAVNCSCSTMYSAIPGRCGSCQNRLQDCWRALSRLIDGDVAIRSQRIIQLEFWRCDHFEAPKRAFRLSRPVFRRVVTIVFTMNVWLAICPDIARATGLSFRLPLA